MNYFDPTQGFNAFVQGAQIGGGIRKAKTNNALAPMVAAGDYKGAAQYAGQRGDLGAAQDLTAQYQQQIAQMSAEQKAQAAQRAEGTARIALEGMSVPEDQLGAWIQTKAPELMQYGIQQDQIAQWAQGGLTRDALKGYIDQVTPLAELLKTQVVADGSQLWQGGRMVGENPKEVAPQGPNSAIGKLRADLQAGIITPEDYQIGLAQLQRSGVNVNLNTGANGPEVGTIPPGYAIVQDPNNPSGYRMEAIPGGPAGTEAQGAAQARKSLENTFRTMFLSYRDLQGQGAIRDTDAGLGANASAYLQSSPVGREVGKFVGAPAEATRETIEALQPAISQAIMSQPGMSARSMDSERELQFFIRSITAPTADVWANYATLHALDSRFGSGQLLNSLLQANEITQEDYDRVTRSPRVAAIRNAMDQKIGELFQMDQQQGETLSPEDAAELEELRRWKKDRGIP